jgi:hypothetical protein
MHPCAEVKCNIVFGVDYFQMQLDADFPKIETTVNWDRSLWQPTVNPRHLGRIRP